MKILCSFSGKFGDVIWSLPTVRHISRMHKQPVELMTMPTYYSLIPLLEQQSYISRAFVDDNWLCSGSPHGDQPNIPQDDSELQKEYDVIYHLTYQSHPGIHYTGKACIDFIAMQQNITLEEPVCPFIEVDSKPDECIAFGFNPDYAEMKQRFKDIFMHAVHVPTVDVTRLPWHAAAEVINSAMAFIGDRSSNWVMAHGVAQKNILVYEPNTSRDYRAFHNAFGNPHWTDTNLYPDNSPEQSAEVAIEWISKIKENQYVPYV